MSHPANKPRDVLVLTERFTDEVKLIARIGELVQARSQFAVALVGDAWEVAYPETTEVQL